MKVTVTGSPPDLRMRVKVRSGLPSPLTSAVATRTPDAGCHREAHRQGLKAQARRSATLAQLDSWESLQQLARDTEGPPSAPFTLVIEIDAWNIRESAKPTHAPPPMRNLCAAR